MTKLVPALAVVFAFATFAACGSSSDGSPASVQGDAGASSNDASSMDGATDDASPSGDGAATSDDGGIVLADCLPFQDTGGATSKWAHVDTTGKLAYATLPKGERILDFSYAGYAGGGVAIPVAPVKQTVTPSGADDTTAIQNAIDAVSQLAPTAGLRGAVLLAPGTFHVSGTLTIAASGVVLRGSGSNAQGTLVDVTGAPRTFIVIGGTGSWKTIGTPAKIADAYVPSGARTFHVDSAAGLAVGASVVVDRPVTAAWIHFMGMDTMVRNGMPETWLAAGTNTLSDRIVTAIAGDAVTIDAPLTDSLDAQYTTGTIAAYTFAGRIENVGLESMHIVAPMQTVPINQPLYDALSMNAVLNGWIRGVVADEFTNGLSIGETAKWITIEDTSVSRTAPIDGSQGYPFQYSIDGQGTLVQRCTASGNNVFSYATMGRSPGPNVVLRFRASGNPTNLQPHMRWSTGLLLDGIDSPAGGIALMNRGWDGSGHGWAIGFGVLWNGAAKSLLIQQPPGSQNWAIGSSGTLQSAAAPGSTSPTPLPSGIVDSPNVAVAPQSLYLAQLCERLGRSALANIGY